MYALMKHGLKEVICLLFFYHYWSFQIFSSTQCLVCIHLFILTVVNMNNWSIFFSYCSYQLEQKCVIHRKVQRDTQVMSIMSRNNWFQKSKPLKPRKKNVLNSGRRFISLLEDNRNKSCMFSLLSLHIFM